MAKQIGFRTTGANQDTYLYLENAVGESFSYGNDVGTGTLNINSSTSTGVFPDEVTANITIDAAVNGDISFQPNGTGDSYFVDGDVVIQSGNLLMPNTASSGAVGVIEFNNSRYFHNHNQNGNIFVGLNSGNFTLTAQRCTAFGQSTLRDLSSGNFNDAFGSAALSSLTTGTQNMGFGFDTLSSCVDGNRNVGLGGQALLNLTTGDRNLAVGRSALLQVTNATGNVALGCGNTVGGGDQGPLYNLLTGNYNIGIGSSLGSITTGPGANYTGSESSNIVIGSATLGTMGESNTMRLGTTGSGDGEVNRCFLAGTYGITPAGASHEIMIMDADGQTGTTSGGSMFAATFDTDAGTATPSAGVIDILGGSNINTAGATNVVTVNLDNTVTISGDFTTTGGDVILDAGNISLPATNAALSEGVITSNSTRVFHTYPGAISAVNAQVFIGAGAGNGTMTGVGNYIISASGGANLTTGQNNTGIGSLVFEDLVSGSGNAAVGTGALRNVLGSQNIAMGNSAGSACTTGSYNTFLGYVAGSAVGSASNSNIYINHAGTSENNTMRLGTTGTGNGQVNTTFIAGVTSQTITGTTTKPMVIETTGQVGVAGNINLPDTNAAFTDGVLTINGVRFLHKIGNARSTFVGPEAGNTATTGTANTGVGWRSLDALTSGTSNTCVGDSSGGGLTNAASNTLIGQAAGLQINGDRNTILGHIAGNSLTTGTNNILLGYAAGTNYTTSDSSNIVIASAATGPESPGESNVIRIGTQGSGAGQQNECHIAGIYNVTPAGGNDGVVIIDSNGQLGSTTAPTDLTWNVATGSTQAVAVNNAYFANYNGTLAFTLPATAAVGDTMQICQMFAGQGWSLAQNAGQTCYIGNSSTTTGAGGSLASTDDGDWIEIVCRVANTDFQVNVKSGNITVV